MRRDLRFPRDRLHSPQSYLQSVGSNTSTTIEAGKIIAKTRDGAKSVGGSCKDGDKIKIVEDKDVVVILPM